MMTTLDIYKNARENLMNLAQRQQELAHRSMNTQRYPEWRAKYMATKAKVQWLDKLIALWEVR